ncbi:Crp/Fnr family transcriptional regulator [Suipraeoptans intestinalis]|uniref:Crp/Fnr family transcriptional regulator n=1 Tax=Suipraeoptans intestinalis TaxID=2606628 RepID=UPI0023F23095|nr:Crp/Fnr family transcriptional regulator [Suipraeoptans intestinalis]MDD7769705.1 Crp/Fnr family transcriptional regulator [Suipraeoptans intestinalis]MDY3121934.1 Crp/Fnr family transcriptional regulator [Suipraeoptans intestinalis]
MDIHFLQNTLLFQDMTLEEIHSCLSSLNAQEKEFQKGELIFHAGDSTEKLGLVLSGSVTIEINDVWGSRTILSQVREGQFFAETYALLPSEVLLVDVSADRPARILFLTVRTLKELQTINTSWAFKFLSSLLSLSFQKNLLLSQRSFHTAPKTIRGRVLAYLHTTSLKTHKNCFTIPFDRQQLADYLNVDRTALSKELSKMKQERLIDFRKNYFELLTDPD